MRGIRHVTCPKCVELWHEYAEATREHVRLLKEQERGKELVPQVELAMIRRDSVRAGIRIHLAVDHAGEPSLTVSAG
jgi:hypothetical protein